MSLNPISEGVLKTLRAELSDTVFHAAEPRYLEDPRGLTAGQAGAVLAPGSTEDVSTILRHANDAQVAVVPFGGGTGLVGGQIMPVGPAPIVLSLERMNRVRELYPDDNVVVAEAGVILQNLQQAATDADRLFPLSLASQGSCQIGGNLATNAGGVNVLRYGNTRELCLGLEAVLPNGDIWHGLKRLRKDNTGYDLRNLLIGAEGTLGVITAASLRLFARPAELGAALFVVADPSAAVRLLARARQIIGDGVNAFELIDGTGLDFLTETMPQIRQPFATPPRWSVLIDLGLPMDGNPTDCLERLFVAGMEDDSVSDGVIAASLAQRQDFWTIRENIPLANKAIGPVSSHDISVPMGAIPDFIAQGGEKIAALGDFRINAFGHLGDGNLHYNVFPVVGAHRDDMPDMPAKVRRVIYDLVAEYDGSFSAEHGVGRAKTAELAHYGDPTKRSAMQAIKTALDPNGIMNPGVIFS